VSLLMKHTCDDEVLAEKGADGVYGYLRPQYVRNQLGNVSLIANMLSELYQPRLAPARVLPSAINFLFARPSQLQVQLVDGRTRVSPLTQN
jgi:hypothetical protein